VSAAAETTRTLVVERVFPHPLEKRGARSPRAAARAMDDGQRLRAAWSVGVSIPARSRAQLNGVVDATVLIVAPFERLSYTWGVGKSETSAGLQWWCSGR